MADPGQPPRPGPDEIVVSAPVAGELCSSLEHRRAGRPAQVVVTLGQIGTAEQHRQAVWMQCWGRSYPHVRAVLGRDPPGRSGPLSRPGHH